MIYPTLNLQTVELFAGLALALGHGIGLLHAARIQKWLKAFPRSGAAGLVLLTAATAWAFLLVYSMDLGEFSPYRRALLVLVPVACFLAWKYVDEFLAVRALGMLLLLLAEPLLESAFLQPGAGRLLLAVLAYAWVVMGLFWVGMPYLLRDQIDWWTRSAFRWRAGCVGGLVFGLALAVNARC